VKKLIKGMLPSWMIPIAQRIYRKVFNDPPKPDFSESQYHLLTALKCAVSYNKYGGYCVPESSRHRPAAKTILSNDVYEPKTIEFIISNCGNGDVVHAGTYFGDFLPALSKHCSTNSIVWAFEPNSENYLCANITIQLNYIQNVSLKNAGLGAKKEYSLMRTADETGRSLGGGSRIISEFSNEPSGTEKVEIVTIDDTVPTDRVVSIIQLDVEGYEKEALSGALMTIKRCLPIIVLEVLPNSTLLDSDWFTDNILSLGYRIKNTIHDNTVFMCESKI